jgi:uncharacterized glyoxalase superfamily protein PhnB
VPTHNHDGAKLGNATPIFRVADLALALDWYQSVLGFQVAWTWGDPADHAGVCRDSAQINLVVEPGAQPRISRAYFETRGVDAYYNRVSRAGGQIAVALGDRPYGMRDFRVVDAAGNELSFGEPTSS